MWLCLNNAFVSVVASDDGRLMVRARNKKHLRALFPKAKVLKTPFNDYRFRVIVSRKRFAKLIASRVENIDYTNFKDSVGDLELHNLYLKFWRLHFAYQADLEYGPCQPSRFYDDAPVAIETTAVSLQEMFPGWDHVREGDDYVDDETD
jgi:hypothetical protein